MEINVDKIKEAILPILKEKGVLRSSIFGSYAAEEVKENSDVDILVELPEGKSLFDLAGLQLELEDRLGRKVDVLTYNSIHPLLRDKILGSQIPIL